MADEAKALFDNLGEYQPTLADLSADFRISNAAIRDIQKRTGDDSQDWLPCPFCRSLSVGLFMRLAPGFVPVPGTFRVFCERCECQGPAGETEQMAFDKWGIRK